MLQYWINPDQRLATITLRGSIAGEDVVAALEAVFPDAKWQPDFDVLWDCTGVEQLVFTPEDASAVKDVLQRISDRMGPGRSAIVVHRDLDFQIAMLVLLLSKDSQRERRIFRDMEEALAWLGLEELPEPSP